MDDLNSDKEERIKQAFSKIKGDIDSLKAEFNTLKGIIIRQEDLLEAFLAEMAKNKQDSLPNGGFSGLPGEGSSGSEGVQTNKQTNKQTHPKQTNTQTHPFPAVEQLPGLPKTPTLLPPATPVAAPPTLSNLKKTLMDKFAGLPKREFLIFLTIYQMELDKGTVSYTDLANHLKLSESGIRHYVFNLIKKGAPLQKRKINNKTTVLSLSSEFKEYNLQKELVDLYLHLDSHQRTLTDEY
jgi:hypothetical protein